MLRITAKSSQNESLLWNMNVLSRFVHSDCLCGDSVQIVERSGAIKDSKIQPLGTIIIRLADITDFPKKQKNIKYRVIRMFYSGNRTGQKVKKSQKGN